MEPGSLAEVSNHFFAINSRIFANNVALQSNHAPQGVTWSCAATCDDINPCRKVGAICLSKADLETTSAFSGHFK